MEKTKILICSGTSGIAAGADKAADVFKKELRRHKLTDSCRIIKTGGA